MCACAVPIGFRKGFQFFELELQKLVNCQVGAGKQLGVSLQEQPASLTAEFSLTP